MVRLRREVYLDNNATTKVDKDVVKVVEDVLRNYYGNPSSLYRDARKSAEKLEDSRAKVAETINADPREIFFTGSASEANNAILKSVGGHFNGRKRKIISTPIEHASVINTLQYLKEQGMEVEYVPVDAKGRVYLDKLEEMVDDDTCLVCCMLANNEVGTIQNIKKISGIAKKHDALVMSDCVQALGKVRVDVEDLGIDYASFSAHKIHGPKGVGALFVKQGRPISPLIHGGHQEQGLRAGTESLHNIVGFATACSKVDRMLTESRYVMQKKKGFVEELRRIRPDIVINSPEESCLPNTVNITFPGVDSAVFMALLDYNGISVSAGSACNTKDDKPSHVLKAIGLTDQEARETLRFSLSMDTSGQELSYVLKILKEYFEGNQAPLSVVTPAQLNEDILFSDDTYILDIRFWYDREILKGLPNSHEASLVSIRRYLKHIPRNKNIIVVCQMGYGAPVVAYYLMSKDFKKVSFLLSGMMGWKLANPKLYKEHGGKNIVKLKPLV